MPADLTTVIVNWRTPTLAVAAARSAHRATPPGMRHEIVVVDNASGDGSADAIVSGTSSAGVRVELICNADNVGFAAANNQGIECSEAPYVLLLNSDALLGETALQKLLERVAASPRAAAVGSRLVYEGGRFQRWTAGADPGLRSVGLYLAGLDRLRLFASSGLYLGRDVASARAVGWVSAACMLLRRAAVVEAGMMDERYFYMEDVDLCRRLRRLGYEVWYEPAATTVHLMGQSVERSGPGARARAVGSLNSYFAGEHSAPAYAALRVLEIGAFGGRAAAHGAMAVAGPERARHGAEARAHWARSVHGGPVLRRPGPPASGRARAGDGQERAGSLQEHDWPPGQPGAGHERDQELVHD